MADIFELNIDGTVTIGWDDMRTRLRRPKVEEWLSFVEEKEECERWANGEVGLASTAVTIDQYGAGEPPDGSVPPAPGVDEEGSADGEESRLVQTAKTMREAILGGPFREMYARLINELGSDPRRITAADLPLWLSDGSTMESISRWWMASPLGRSASVDNKKMAEMQQEIALLTVQLQVAQQLPARPPIPSL